MQDNNDSNAGAAADGTLDSSANGSQGADPSVISTTPDNQNGTPTNQGNAELNRMREEVRRLNQAVVDAKRGNRNNNQQNQDGATDFETPEGQYGIAIQLATGNLRNKMESLISLYPELPAEEVSRIRKNPWAFVSHDTFINADWESASLEIEQVMLTRAEELSASNTVPVNNPNPANVNANPVQETADEAGAVPGTQEDESLWTMPIDKLEAKKNQAVAKVSKSK